MNKLLMVNFFTWKHQKICAFHSCCFCPVANLFISEIPPQANIQYTSQKMKEVLLCKLLQWEKFCEIG